MREAEEEEEERAWWIVGWGKEEGREGKGVCGDRKSGMGGPQVSFTSKLATECMPRIPA